MPTPAQLVTKYPNAARVLHHYDIEFCCEGGKEDLSVICDRRGLIMAEIMAEIQDESAHTGPNWLKAPLPDLIEHILETHHRPLDEELPRLAHLAAKVVRAHPDHGSMLTKVQSLLKEVTQDLTEHMPKEELVLFPLIIAGGGDKADTPIEVIVDEHLRLGELLDELREVTNSFQAPDGACGTWKALWTGLDALTEDLHIHIHLEEHILFPRARMVNEVKACC